MLPKKLADSEKVAVFSALKLIVELSAIWTAFGYFSLRAFCNFYGIPIAPDIGIERYLQETYPLVLYTANRLFTTAYYLLLLLLGVIVMLLLPQRWFDVLGRTVQKITATRTISWMLFGALSVCTFLFGRANLYLYEIGSRAMLVGKLAEKNLSVASQKYYDWNLVLILLSLVSFFLTRSLREAPGLARHGAYSFLRGAFFLFAVLSIVYAPIIYGSSIKSDELYIVRLQSVAGDPVCGIRLLETPTRMLYWRAQNGQGQVESIMVSNLKSVNYLKLAGIAETARAGLKDSVPKCEF